MTIGYWKLIGYYEMESVFFIKDKHKIREATCHTLLIDRGFFVWNKISFGPLNQTYKARIPIGLFTYINWLNLPVFECPNNTHKF